MDERQGREPDEAIGLGAHLLYIFLELNTFLPIKNEFLILGTSEFTWTQGFRMVNEAVQRERSAVERMLSTVIYPITICLAAGKSACEDAKKK